MTDIGSIFRTQTDYLRSLISTSAATPSVPLPATTTTAINSLSVDISNNPAQSILTKQLEMSKIIDNENARLNDKKKSIDQLADSKKRMIQLNTNFIERKEEYKKMLIAVIIGLAIYFVLQLINRIFPIPDILFSLILIVLLSVVGFYCFFIYVKINNRDNMDFDKVAFPPPVTLSAAEIQTQLNKNAVNAAGGKGNLLATMDLGLCVGSACCSSTTVWDVSGQVCVPARQGFQTMAILSNDETTKYKDTQKINTTKTFSPTEYANYSVYRG